MFSKLLSLFFILYITISSALGLPIKGYDSKQLFNDPDFSKGFSVVSQQTENGNGVKLGNFTYGSYDEIPDWSIAQWSSGKCLWADRAESDPYTITDGVSKTVRYNPADKSVSMRLNAANVYNGQPAGDESWPHLLLEQSPIVNYHALSDSDKSFYNCSADRIVLSLDIRLSDFVDTVNKEGINAAQYLAYFYLCGTDHQKFIWFGVNLFDNRGCQDTYWALDKASNKMIYCVSTKDTYGFEGRSLFRKGKPFVSDEWVHIELDLTPHIEDAMKRANESDTFGTAVSKEDFYISGTNIGFEIHGNYDCTVDIRDFRLTSYNKIN